MKRIILLMAVMSLSACASMTPEEYAAKLAEMHGPTCEKLGLEKKSQEWAECVLRLEDQRQAKVAAVYGAWSAQRTGQPTQNQTNCTVTSAPGQSSIITCR